MPVSVSVWLRSNVLYTANGASYHNSYATNDANDQSFLLLFLENPLDTRGIPPEHWLWSLKANLLLQSDSNNI